MNQEEIRNLVLQILETPEVRHLLQGRVMNNERLPKGLVLLEGGSERKSLLFDVYQRWGKEFQLFALIKEGSLIKEPETLKDWVWAGITPMETGEALKDQSWGKLILPDCSADTLAKAALGIQDTSFARLIGWGICEGIPIYLSTQYLGLGAKTPEAYRRLFQEYLLKLSAFGVQVYTPHTEQQVITYNKKLLADKDVLTLPPNTILSIRKGTIVSPLAIDSLKRNKIKLEFEMEGQI